MWTSIYTQCSLVRTHNMMLVRMWTSKYAQCSLVRTHMYDFVGCLCQSLLSEIMKHIPLPPPFYDACCRNAQAHSSLSKPQQRTCCLLLFTHKQITITKCGMPVRTLQHTCECKQARLPRTKTKCTITTATTTISVMREALLVACKN